LKNFELVGKLMVGHLFGEWHLCSCEKFANQGGFMLFLLLHCRAPHCQLLEPPRPQYIPFLLHFGELVVVVDWLGLLIFHDELDFWTLCSPLWILILQEREVIPTYGSKLLK
jgi:hypothetical protein